MGEKGRRRLDGLHLETHALEVGGGAGPQHRGDEPAEDTDPLDIEGAPEAVAPDGGQVCGGLGDDHVVRRQLSQVPPQVGLDLLGHVGGPGCEGGFELVQPAPEEPHRQR